MIEIASKTCADGGPMTAIVAIGIAVVVLALMWFVINWLHR